MDAMRAPFVWWRVEDDGTARPYRDSAEIRQRVNRERRWYGSIEGAILDGGVRATAYDRKTEMTYDAAHWLATREMKPTGLVTTRTVSAERE